MASDPATGPHNSPNAPGGPGYETRDVNVGGLLKFAVSLAVVLIVVWFGMRWVRDYYAETQNLGPSASPFENARTIPPLPRLQVAPQKEIHDYWESQQGLVNSYGWVDRQNGVVRIPVDRAMRILLQRGFPARQAGAAKEAGGEKAAGVQPEVAAQ